MSCIRTGCGLQDEVYLRWKALGLWVLQCLSEWHVHVLHTPMHRTSLRTDAFRVLLKDLRH